MKQRPFVVFDIDGTLIRWQMLHAVIDRLGRAGHFTEADYASILNARKAWKERKTEEAFRDYEMHLIGILVANLKQLHVDHFDAAVEQAFADYKDQAYRYTTGLIRELKQKGYLLFAVSGSPQEIVALLAEHYGFDDFVGTDHVRSGNGFTGEVMVAVHDKPKHVKSLMAKHQVSLDGSIGVGDSEGDIDMLAMVEHPIAFNPSRKLFHHAQAQGWKVVVERKNMIYELEHRDGHYRLMHTSDEN
jgi:HAD superfamily hydrolase (TIGR01490 family)